ncbi:toll/interleukin-1 receptor domain-containing protein [Variovorax rhizosphaerae]|uniref:Toll/interleukin-1 receptor domain-containing protein n=1 Tax=Variovorax rhizosphaerae TaxID=1836200 RepID=A0ABU8WVN6_9BURK
MLPTTLSYCGLPFQHDIFVSYSHGSDARGEPSLQHWSLAFVRALREELRADRAFRDALSLFIDAEGEPGRRLDAALPLAEQLEAQVQSAAVLLVLMSPDYQASKWCADERQWWLKKQAELGISATGRLEMVKVWPVLAADWKDGKWPQELADRAGEPLLGHLFHDGAQRGARPLGWTQWQQGFDSRVRESVLDLARVLYNRLDDVKAECDRLRSALADAQRLGGAAGQMLYLHGRSEQQAEWEQTAGKLQDGGFAVLPAIPDPVERDPMRREAQRERRVEELAGCDALLLLGTPASPTLDADLATVGKFDRQSARERSNRLLPCGLLDTTGAALATPQRRTNARILQTEWLDAVGGQVVPVVQQWLQARAGTAGG